MTFVPLEPREETSRTRWVNVNQILDIRLPQNVADNPGVSIVRFVDGESELWCKGEPHEIIERIERKIATEQNQRSAGLLDRLDAFVENLRTPTVDPIPFFDEPIDELGGEEGKVL